MVSCGNFQPFFCPNWPRARLWCGLGGFYPDSDGDGSVDSESSKKVCSTTDFMDGEWTTIVLWTIQPENQNKMREEGRTTGSRPPFFLPMPRKTLRFGRGKSYIRFPKSYIRIISPDASTWPGRRVVLSVATSRVLGVKSTFYGRGCKSRVSKGRNLAKNA